MKTLQSSSRGRGVGSNIRGRGMRGRGGRHNDDTRFASRFTDPRFKLSARVSNQRHAIPSPREQLLDAARSDPRFADRFPGIHEETEDPDIHEDGIEEVDTYNEYEDAEVDEEEVRELDDEVNAWAPDEVDYTEARRRVAIVNCDWDHIRAVDLFAVLFHALPLGGQLQDVCVYLSDFGKKMIEHERVHGPNLWVTEDDDMNPNHCDGMNSTPNEPPIVEELPEDISDDEVSNPQSDGWVDDDPNMMTEQGEHGELFSIGRYRLYERNRLKYYYAIATFDSVATAAAVYDQLDGMDIEASGVVLDLRYVEDDETFSNPVSRADCIPPNFTPVGAFKVAALSQSRFRVSWDQEDVFRHRSVQDSFTGTSADDDLAAYLAPPDSSEDEVDARTGRSTNEEKMKIRRKYAALLEEIGGIPEDLQEARGEDDRMHEEGESGDDDDSDDDSLNRFSDVELDSSDGGDSYDVDRLGDNESLGEMEATLDLNLDSKATQLQREALMKQKMKKGDLGTKADVKYKLKRKEMKRAKKEMLHQERDAKRTAFEAQRDAQKEQLKKLVGNTDMDTAHLSGKERRKEHARKVKVRLAEERHLKKQRRAANALGVTREWRQQEEAEQAVAGLDPRFKGKLLSDPRFQLEVAQRDKRVNDEVANLAATVAKGRHARRGSGADKPTDNGKRSNEGTDVETAVDYFLSTPGTKRQRRA